MNELIRRKQAQACLNLRKHQKLMLLQEARLHTRTFTKSPAQIAVFVGMTANWPYLSPEELAKLLKELADLLQAGPIGELVNQVGRSFINLSEAVDLVLLSDSDYNSFLTCVQKLSEVTINEHLKVLLNDRVWPKVFNLLSRGGQIGMAAVRMLNRLVSGKSNIAQQLLLAGVSDYLFNAIAQERRARGPLLAEFGLLLSNLACEAVSHKYFLNQDFVYLAVKLINQGQTGSFQFLLFLLNLITESGGSFQDVIALKLHVYVLNVLDLEQNQLLTTYFTDAVQWLICEGFRKGSADKIAAWLDQHSVLQRMTQFKLLWPESLFLLVQSALRHKS